MFGDSKGPSDLVVTRRIHISRIRDMRDQYGTAAVDNVLQVAARDGEWLSIPIKVFRDIVGDGVSIDEETIRLREAECSDCEDRTESNTCGRVCCGARVKDVSVLIRNPDFACPNYYFTRARLPK